jgi:hypothetical protein
MRASIKTKLDKLDRRVPPTWEDLQGLIFWAAEKPSDIELDALIAQGRGRATPEQDALVEAFYDRNLPRIHAYWTVKYPGWEAAPFWEEVGPQEGDNETV